MTRAEEKAIDAWSIYEYREHPKGLYHTCFVDGYKEGYEQAEEDLALTKEDVRCIFNLVRDLQTKYSATEGCLQEAADIFNEQRKK